MIQGLPYQQKRPLFGSFYHLGSLSFETRNPIIHKVLHSYLDVGGALERKKLLVIWRDIINNALTPHKKTDEYPVSGLLSIFQKYKTRVEAIVYIQRFGAPPAPRVIVVINLLNSFNELIESPDNSN